MPPAVHPNATWLQALRGRGKLIAIQRGATIIYQGQHDAGLYYIEAGIAHAVFLSEDGDEVWLGQIDPGEFIGDAAWISGHSIGYELIAASNMSAIHISTVEVERLIVDHPDLFHKLASGIAKKHIAQTQRQVEAVSMTAPGRICAELLRLAQPMGTDENALVIRPIPTFAKLATRLATTRETVSRTVSTLNKRNIIQRSPGAIIINNASALKASIE